MGVKRIVWVSRHELTQRNHEILQQAFGNYKVIQYSQTVHDVRQLKDFADSVSADAYVVVLPPHLIQQLMQIDSRPIYRFIVERRMDEEGNVKFIPIGLELIEEIKVVTKRIV